MALWFIPWTPNADYEIRILSPAGSLRCFLLGKQFYSDRASIYPYVYSYFEKGCRKKCARDNPER